MSAGTPTLGRLFILLVSSTLALLAAGAFLRSRRPADTVKMEDRGAAQDEMLQARRAELPEGERPTVDGQPGTWPRPFVSEPLDKETAASFFPALDHSAVFDPHVYVRRKGGVDHRMRFPEHPDGGWRVRTNSEGLREDDEIRTEQPDVRILVGGDSHTDGLCPNEASFANVLEALLADERPGETVEVLNTGTGAYHFYNYLGVLERFRELRPDLYVIAVYGGNDFYKNLGLLRYFERLPPPSRGPVRLGKLIQSKEDAKGAVPQELGQVVHFLNNPSDIPLAIDNACSLTREMHRIASEMGTELVFVYLPPPFVGQPQHFEKELRRTTEILGVEPGSVEISNQVADPWLDYARGLGITCLDLRPVFREDDELKYWRTDHHLNIVGHRHVAELLLPLVEPLL